MQDKGFIRWKEAALTGLSRTLVWRLEQRGQFRSGSV
jgi:predicted DNA-binding transcriptional regulator AlpA